MERSNRNLWIGLGVLAIVLLVALPAAGGGMMFYPGVHPFGGPWMWGFWGFGALVRLLFFGLIFFLVLRVFRGGGWWRGYRGYYDDEPHRTELSAQEILRRRYAAGEITREQYEEMRRTLEPSTI